jgi:cytochrome P450
MSRLAHLSSATPVHQIKTFLLAGQDTAATLVQWLCYEMYKNPEVSYYLREERDLAFGSGAFSAGDMLSQPGKADRILAPIHHRCRQ